MKEKIPQIDDYIKRMDKQALLISFGFMLLMLIAPFILTRSLNMISFSQTGQIGDTIGGITAPIIGLLAAMLVYLSFRAQIKANKVQMEALLEERERVNYENEIKFIDALLTELHKLEYDDNLKRHLNSILSLFNSIEERYRLNINVEEDKISNAIKQCQPHFPIFLRNINLIMVIKNKIDKINFQDDIQKDYIMASFKFSYIQTFSIVINSIIKQYRNLLFYDKNKLPDELINLMEKKCIPINEWIENLVIK